MNIRITKGKRPEYSKQLVSDIRALLWVVTVGGLAFGRLLHPGGLHRVPALGICHGGTAMDGPRRGVQLLSEYGKV